jgi:hypothetical protein
MYPYTTFGLSMEDFKLPVALENQKANSVGTIKRMFEEYANYIEIDQKLADRINNFQVAFVNKNEDHMAFFGGNLTGVQIVRFTNEDLNKFYTDVVGIDNDEIEEELHRLDVIHTERIVSSDVFAHICMWLIHRFMNSKLNAKTIERTIQSLNLIILYKFLTSLLFNYFRFPADPEIAIATYASLSNKFAIKQLGSWSALLEDRTKDICTAKGLHHQTIKNYVDDEKILYAITDTQGRIRDMLKNIYREFILTYERGNKIKTQSSSFEYEGEEILRDKTKNLGNYINYIYSILPEKHTFIKDEILTALEGVVHTAPKKLVQETLEWMSDNYRYHNTKEIEDLVKSTLLHSFNYLSDNRTVMKNNTNLITLSLRLKGIYMSSKTKDAEIKKIRSLSEKMVRKATTTKNNSLIISVRVSVLLYIVLRAFTIHHYS